MLYVEEEDNIKEIPQLVGSVDFYTQVFDNDFSTQEMPQGGSTKTTKPLHAHSVPEVVDFTEQELPNKTVRPKPKQTVKETNIVQTNQSMFLPDTVDFTTQSMEGRGSSMSAKIQQKQARKKSSQTKEQTSSTGDSTR